VGGRELYFSSLGRRITGMLCSRLRMLLRRNLMQDQNRTRTQIPTQAAVETYGGEIARQPASKFRWFREPSPQLLKVRPEAHHHSVDSHTSTGAKHTVMTAALGITVWNSKQQSCPRVKGFTSANSRGDRVTSAKSLPASDAGSAVLPAGLSVFPLATASRVSSYQVSQLVRALSTYACM
jgi:hypothetical protein